MVIVVTTNNTIEIKEIDEFNYFTLGMAIGSRKIDPIRSLKAKDISSDRLFFGIDSDGSINGAPYNKFATELSNGYDLYGDVVICKELANYDLAGFESPVEAAEVILQLVSNFPYLQIDFVKDEPSIDVVKSEKKIVSDVTYITFGAYPQRLVLDDDLIKALDNINDVNNKGYISFHNNEYQRICMPLDTAIYIDKSKYSLHKGKNYYYKVEPITWQVLYNSDDILLLSDKVIDYYYYNKQKKEPLSSEKTIDDNEFYFSDIRKFLNRYFYNKAFNNIEKEKIVSSISSNELVEKVSLVSKDIVEYILQIDGYTTDYAATLGCIALNRMGLTNWWLKSKGNKSDEVLIISDRGYVPLSHECNAKKSGIRPLIHLSKEE